MKKRHTVETFFEPVINHYVQLDPTLQATAAASIDKA